jgi:tetratricopeptide (TPR) repeat protein
MVSTKLMDSPEPEQIQAVINRWQMPERPENLQKMVPLTGHIGIGESGCVSSEKSGPARGLRSKKQLQKLLIEWLYDFIRLNVKRGRIFSLREVLETGKADCLGYAKLFTLLGRECGLDTGVVEVIIDSRGMNVPHTASLVKLPGGQPQFIDFWYGSRDIRHRKLGLRVKQADKWQIEDIDYKDLKNIENISYLPDYCVDAITLYIEGNRFLKKGDYIEAIDKYTEAVRLYPENARTFYNRAIALENLGESARAQADYTRALQNAASATRILATQPEDIVDLIHLDEENIPESSQQIYLLKQGFITGRKESPARIAQKVGLSTAEVKAILDSVENTLAIQTK